MPYSDDEMVNEDLIDAYHDGYLSLRSRTSSPYPAGPMADAWAEGLATARRDLRVRVSPVERPEGYYHMALCA